MIVLKAAAVAAVTLSSLVVTPQAASATKYYSSPKGIQGAIKEVKYKTIRKMVYLDKFTVSRATAYSTEGCDSSGGGSLTAMGTKAYFGEVANNFLPLGTKIHFTRSIFGRRNFRVEDRIGWGSELDIWLHCGRQMQTWEAMNNPSLTFYTYKIVTKKKKYVVWRYPKVSNRNSLPTVEGKVAIIKNGIAYAPESAPDKVKNAIWAGNKIAKTPYLWGGGHGSFDSNGYDCSGSVSYVLHGGGFLASPLDSGSLMSWGSAGSGKWITIYANSGHVWMRIAGVLFDTSGASPSRWQVADKNTSLYSARRPVNM